MLLFTLSLLATSSPDITHSTQHMHAAPWKTKHTKISQPPALTGKQMGVVETPGTQPLGYTMDGNVKIFHLIAQPIEQLLTDGKKASYAHLIPKKNKADHLMHMHNSKKTIKAWGYNGSTPGPTIEATEGDRIRIILKNELPEPTSIHWHGLEIPNDQDGAAGETEPPLMPGKTRTYEFTLYQSGTFMYHSGFNVTKQDHMGLSGALVIHPKKYESKPDKQFVLFLQQWALLPGNDFPHITSMDFNWFTFNGHTAPNIPPLEIEQGDRVRLRFANTIMDSHPIHIHGYAWTEVGTEGGPIPKLAQKKGSTIHVPPGTTRDVEFVAWNPGLWRLHCHRLHHIMNAHAEIPLGLMPHGGMFTLVYVKPKDPNAPWKHPNQATPMYKEVAS